MPKVSQNYDFKKIESNVSSRWAKLVAKIKATTQFDAKKPIFSFLEGPPTANAPPGLHHMEMRIFKDVMCRFKHMQGFTVPRKGGWDCHGLPVEVQVEKKLGLKTKKDVVTYGIEKFNKECRTDVFTFIKHWEENTKKLAYWIDLDNPYRTVDNNYIESVWWSLKELFNKGFLYEGHKVVPYCPRCETPLSSHEVALGYKDVTEETITVKFKVKDKPNRYFLAWTTTPWTLPSNMCLAVNAEIIYAIVKEGNNEYILAKDLVKKYFEDAQIIKEIKGKELAGIEYQPLFDYYVDKLSAKAWFVVIEDYVSTEEGTGIVHQAPAFGEIDYDSCKKHNVAFVQPVDNAGKFTSDVKDFAGIFVKTADTKIIDYLDNKGLLFKTEKYLHSYPFCWRCNTPLLYYAMVSWFIAVTKIKDRLVKLNQEITWYPNHIKDGRFGNWLESAKDWALSRTKFWGTPLPIWRCESCKKLEVIGSVDELRKKGNNVAKELDLHKPYVDQIILKCSCGREMKRIPDVIDCWYDSGAAQFAQLHYPFENKELFEKYHPYDFIAEGIDQTRGWFYTLHVLSAILFDRLAYKRCAVGGLVCDDKGEKMSKSKGNIIVPEEMFEKVGVDVVRILMCSYPFGENIRFGMQPINETINPFLRILWNSFYYVNEFLDMHNINHKVSASTLAHEDQWLISRVNSLIIEVDDSLDSGRFNQALGAIQSFVNEDLSRWYIKLVRDRAIEKDEALAYTFRYVFERLIKLLAPFSPYLSDEMYELFMLSKDKKESVHFDNWPKVDNQSIDKDLENNMDFVKTTVSAINHAREQAGLSLRWPVQDVIIVSESDPVLDALNDVALKEIIKSQCNIKIVNTEKLLDEDKDNYAVADFELGKVYVNKETNSELEAEGFAREIMRRSQALRKKSGLIKTDVVELYVKVDKDLEIMLKNWNEKIKDKCGAKELTISSEFTTKEFRFKSEEKVKEKTFVVMLNKV